MPDKEESLSLGSDRERSTNLDRGDDQDIRKSSLPDFQYTPVTPPTPSPKESDSTSTRDE